MTYSKYYASTWNMGWSHQTFNTSELDTVIETHEEYKLPYTVIVLDSSDTWNSPCKYEARLLITLQYYYLESSRIDTDCDGTDHHYSRKFAKNNMGAIPKSWQTLVLYPNGGPKIIRSVNISDYIKTKSAKRRQRRYTLKSS